MLWVFVLAAALLAAFLLAMRPTNQRRAQMSPFQVYDFAHRGWHDESIPENSLPAFAQAIARGYGIELDVRLTKDGQVVVFHDATLSRLCGRDLRVSDCDYAWLQTLTLGDSAERIPLLSEALALIHGQTPIIVELKPDRKRDELCYRTTEELANYNGKYCIESFSPWVLHWYKRQHPQVLRGQLASKQGKDSGVPWLLRPIYTYCLTNFLTRPDFIAYDRRYCRRWYLHLWRGWNVFLIGWTVRSAKQLRAARGIFDGIIFENFDPQQEAQHRALP